MSYILHLGHQPSDIGVDPLFLVTTTDNGTTPAFDSSLDNNAIAYTVTDSSGILPSSIDVTPSIGWPEPSSDTIWFQFRWRTGTHQRHDDDANGGARFVDIIDSTGNSLFRIRPYDSGGIEFLYYSVTAFGDSTVENTTVFEPGSDTVYWIDIKVTVNASNVTGEFYVDGSLLGSATTTNSTSSFGKPRSAVINCIGQANYTGSPSYGYLAHFAVLDNVSTINRRFIRQRPNTAGTDTGFAGSVSALADGLPSTVMSSDTAGQRQSFSITGPTIPASAFNAVHIVSKATQPVTGGTSPTQLSGYLKIGGTNYDVTAETVTTNQIVSTWNVDPSTTNSWDNTNLPTEFGLLSST